MIHFDWTIRLSDVFLIGGGIAAFIRMFTSMRDTLRDLSVSLNGLRKDVDRHEEWLRDLWEQKR